MQEILKSDAKFRYMMLDRMRSDCEYYLGNGNRYAKNLWAGNEVDHIANMKALWNSFPEDGKPEWLPYEKILEYEKEMCPQATLSDRQPSLEEKISKAKSLAGCAPVEEIVQQDIARE